MSDETIRTFNVGDLPPDRGPSNALKANALGSPHITALALAPAAPSSSIAATIPVAILLGAGVGTPGAIFGAAIVLLIFAVGYVRMVPHVRNAGAIYAIVANGLGKPAGLAGSYLVLAAYIAFGGTTVGGLSFYIVNQCHKYFDINLPWWACALVAIAVVSFLTWRGVDFAARVLFVALTLDLLAIGVVDVAILLHQGIGSFSLAAISPSSILSGSVGVAAILAVFCFTGFEGTADYAEEAKEPVRSIPRATYSAIIIIALVYGLSTWSLLAGAGFDQAQDRVAQDPGTFVFGLADQYVGAIWSDILGLLIVTSCFAGLLACQSASSRYFFALARDGLLPKSLARTDPNYKTPVAGILWFAAIMAILVAAFAAAKMDPLLQLGTAMTGVGTVCYLVLMVLASLSVVAFFVRRGDRRPTVTVLPLIATVILGLLTIIGIIQYESLIGTDSPVISSLRWIFVPIAGAGIAFAYYVKSRQPDKYELIGTTHVK